MHGGAHEASPRATKREGSFDVKIIVIIGLVFATGCSNVVVDGAGGAGGSGGDASSDASSTSGDTASSSTGGSCVVDVTCKKGLGGAPCGGGGHCVDTGEPAGECCL